jgi:hypothetical protein
MKNNSLIEEKKKLELINDFHKFSVFMADSVESGKAKYKDVERSISYFWIDKMEQAILDVAKDTRRQVLEEVERNIRQTRKELNEMYGEESSSFYIGNKTGLDEALQIIKTKKDEN